MEECKVTGAANAAKDPTGDGVKYIADGVKEAAILLAGTCKYPIVGDDTSKVCAFGTCFKAAYTVTSVAAKT